VPTYQYACTQCEHRFEQVQSFSDASLTECPVCGGKLRKVYGSVGVVFKGSGFYRTDSRNGAAGSAPGEKAESGDKADKGDKGKAAAKESTPTTSGQSSAAASSAGSSSSGSTSSGTGAAASGSGSGSGKSAAKPAVAAK
jgi:putative FmdB family regulatory protein